MSNNSFEVTRLARNVGKPDEVKYAESLDDQELYEMSCDGVVTCADGCRTEPDGACEHGYSSPLILLGLI